MPNAVAIPLAYVGNWMRGSRVMDRPAGLRSTMTIFPVFPTSSVLKLLGFKSRERAPAVSLNSTIALRDWVVSMVIAPPLMGFDDVPSVFPV